MGYTPYKMLGHELPGPNQYKNKSPNTLKAFGTKDTEFLNQESTDTSTSLNYGAAVGSSPNKKELVGDQHTLPGHLKAKIEAAPSKMLGGISGAQGSMQSAATPPAPAIPPHGDESHSGGAEGTAVPTEETTEQPFQVASRNDYFGMRPNDRKDYMRGLTKEQRQMQMKEVGVRPGVGGIFGVGGFGGMGGGTGGFGGGMFS